jgi:hypothetical protein
MELNPRSFILVGVAVLSLVGWPGGAVRAQEEPVWRLALQLADGVYVRAGIGTVPANAVKLDSAHPLIRGVGYLAQRRGALRRILKLANGRAIVYDVVVKSVEQQFEVTLQPAPPTPQEAAQWGIDPAQLETDFLQSYAAPLRLNAGDILAVDVLIEPQSKVKFVDYYLFSHGPPAPKREEPARLFAQARQFSAEDAELRLAGGELRRNGRAVYRHEAAAAQGRFIWLEIPQVGRVSFSLTEQPGFERAAVVSEQQLVFTLGADSYEWLAPQRIAPGSGVYHLWLRRDSSVEKEAAWRIGAAADAAPKPKKE